MKRIFLPFFALFILFSCTQKEKNQIPQKTVITGQVSNFEKVSEHDFIEFIYEDILASQTKFVEEINKDGQFKFILDLDYPTEFFLKYSGLLTFYISPGDSLHFEISGDCWNSISQTYADEYNFYRVTGTSEKMNTDIANYKAFFLDSLNNWNVQDSMIRNGTPNEYKSFLQNLTNERFKELKEFNRKNNTCEQFREWAELNLKFCEWDDLMRYRWLHPMYNKIDRNEFSDSIPADYLDFLNDWDNENKEYLASRDYLSFLHEYSVLYYQKLSKDAFAHLDPNAPNALTENFKIRKEHILNHKPGFIQTVLLAKMYFQFLDAKYYNEIKEIYSPVEIEDLILANKIQAKFNSEKEIFENPQFADGSVLNEVKIENDFLSTVIAKYPDRVIYIDFWAPWCAPCMGEMPYSEKVKKQFNGKEVVFVYLANRCEEAGWKSTVAEKKIEGEHYRLNDKQYAELSQVFGITGIPHYALIDKKGNIVNKNAPRPSNGEELFKLIEKYLN